MDLASMRKNYKLNQLNESEVHKNPFIQFENWINNAIEAQVNEPNAMMLSTCDKMGNSSSRIVLLKMFSEDGFSFFTNYNSNKAKQIAENPNISILFYWNELERQIRIEGVAEKISKEVSSLYFNERPLLSRISAIISPQSSSIESREWLELQHQAFVENKSNELEKPEFWGGYIIKPAKFEFWQGRENRLHDRIQYKLNINNWLIERLAP